MHKLLVIIKREYFSRVKSKGFVIATILTPLLMASLLLVPALLMRGSHANYRVAVLDRTGDAALYERAAGLLTAENASNAGFQVRREAVSEIQFETRRQELKRELGEGTLDSYVVIPASVLDEGKIAYHARNIGDFIAETRIESAFNTSVIERRMIRSGLDVEKIDELSRKILMEKFNERGEGADRRKR